MPAVRYHTGRFPPNERIEWQRLLPYIGPAAAALAQYDEMLSTTSNLRLLLVPLTTQEAVLSSRIEGIRATIGDVLLFEAGQEPSSPRRRDDIHEVLNYIEAMREAEHQLEKLPLSQRVIKDAHQILLRGVRGEGMSPGEYRRIPNWIGPPGCSVNDARFVPIDANELLDAMSAWESYLHAEVADKLVQLAILHAEFEALHPFLDGNGRLGRMVVPLFLWQAGLIQAPMFYISAYFEAHREDYYEGLLAVSRDDDWTGWCQFFLKAIQRQAEDILAKAQAAIDLYEAMKSQVVKLTRSQYAIYALDWAFQRPIFRSTDFVMHSRIPKPTARRILKVFRQDGILKVLSEGSGRRPAVLAFPKLLNIVEGRMVF